MRLLSFLTALFITVLSFITPALATPGSWDHYTFTLDGVTREYDVYEPSWRTTQVMPLLLAFHGGGGNGLSFVDTTGIEAAAEEEGIILVAMQGYDDKWNYGGDMTDNAEVNPQDDLEYSEIVTAAVIANYNPSSVRRYLVGVSAGGMMAYRVICQSSYVYQAVAVVAGTLNVGVCTLPVGRNVYHIHGTQDTNVPFAGGSGSTSAAGANYRPVMDGINIFLNSNTGCGSKVTTIYSVDAFRERYNCDYGVEVSLVRVATGHGWIYSPMLNATGHIIDFFKRH